LEEGEDVARMKGIARMYCNGVEASEILGIERRNILTYVKNGSLAQITPPGKKHSVYLRSQVEELAARMRVFENEAKIPTAAHLEYISEKENALIQLLIDAALLFAHEVEEKAFDEVWRQRWLDCFKDVAKSHHLETAEYELKRQDVLARLRQR
jgi:hypothetical protein